VCSEVRLADLQARDTEGASWRTKQSFKSFSPQMSLQVMMCRQAPKPTSVVRTAMVGVYGQCLTWGSVIPTQVGAFVMMRPARQPILCNIA
jgi:hypothetical protein